MEVFLEKKRSCIRNLIYQTVMEFGSADVELKAASDGNKTGNVSGKTKDFLFTANYNKVFSFFFITNNVYKYDRNLTPDFEKNCST